MWSTYLIDGYNLLHAMGVLHGKAAPGMLEQARVRLQGMLAGAFGDEAHRITLVFDASRAPPGAEAEQFYKGLHVVFAVGPQEADDVIEALLARHGKPKQVAIVSDDRRLKDAARRKGAKPLSCPEFFDELALLRRPGTVSVEEPPEKCERGTPSEINRWLQEFAGLESDPALKEAFEKFGLDGE